MTVFRSSGKRALDSHRNSELLVAQADLLAHEGNLDAACDLYAQAARLEEEALGALSVSYRRRTRGIIGVATVALYFKAGLYRNAAQVAYRLLQDGALPEFAQLELQALLADIWNKQAAWDPLIRGGEKEQPFRAPTRDRSSSLFGTP